MPLARGDWKKYHLTEIAKSQLTQAPVLGKDCRNCTEQSDTATLCNLLKCYAQFVWNSYGYIQRFTDDIEVLNIFLKDDCKTSFNKKWIRFYSSVNSLKYTFYEQWWYATHFFIYNIYHLSFYHSSFHKV